MQHQIVADFSEAQRAFVRGDIDAVARRLYERAAGRAKQRADAVKALRQASGPLSPRQVT